MDNKVLSGLLNPIRMRMMQIVLKNQTATTKMFADDLPHVPPASLYRHINRLVADGILEVCGENRIRGTIEKVYRLRHNPFQEMEDIGTSGHKEEHDNLFYTFAMTLLSDFNNYTSTEGYDLQKDKVGFRSFPLYLNDEECLEFIDALKVLLQNVTSNGPENGRSLRKFSFTIMPTEETERSEES
ncbi:MAG TPA: helix-turn-helix domain-containing protein [Clostridiaceae bacterium]|nr:helix-turn-helix domain-containing protein [Clostridiaceae bacterium]